jgi:Ran GTPase-activating protein (RanGAP) involved in mRNA processing and transport
MANVNDCIMNTDDIENERVAQLIKVQTEALNLFKKKNTDYGDAFAEYGTIGILVRLGDKIKRLQSITKRGINLVEDEKLRDTLIDLHNYAAMGIMVLDEKDKNEDEEEEDYEEDDDDEYEETTCQPVPSEEWEIRGDNGFCYKRQIFVDRSGIKQHTCSCPSFKYCTSTKQTCKHVEHLYLVISSTC